MILGLDFLHLVSFDAWLRSNPTFQVRPADVPRMLQREEVFLDHVDSEVPVPLGASSPCWFVVRVLVFLELPGPEFRSHVLVGCGRNRRP